MEKFSVLTRLLKHCTILLGRRCAVLGQARPQSTAFWLGDVVVVDAHVADSNPWPQLLESRKERVLLLRGGVRVPSEVMAKLGPANIVGVVHSSDDDAAGRPAVAASGGPWHVCGLGREVDGLDVRGMTLAVAWASETEADVVVLAPRHPFFDEAVDELCGEQAEDLAMQLVNAKMDVATEKERNSELSEEVKVLRADLEHANYLRDKAHKLEVELQGFKQREAARAE